MAVAKPKYIPEPREWSDAQVAARLNMSLTYFHDHRAELVAAGMPDRDALLAGRTDSKALELWLDGRSGIGLATNDDEAAALRALRGRRAS